MQEAPRKEPEMGEPLMDTISGTGVHCGGTVQEPEGSRCVRALPGDRGLSCPNNCVPVDTAAGHIRVMLRQADSNHRHGGPWA